MEKNKNIAIQNTDEGSTVAILNKHSDIRVIEEIAAAKVVNYILNLEKRITSEFKLLKHKENTDKSSYKSMKPVGSRLTILYGPGKIHRETRNGPFRLIFSATGTPTYRFYCSL